MHIGTQAAQILLKLRAFRSQIIYIEDNFPKHSPFWNYFLKCSNKDNFRMCPGTKVNPG